MKRFLLCALAFCTTLGAAAQTADTKSEPEGYRFTDGKVLDIPP